MSTLLTVGYGDIYPITTLGRIMAICIAYLGVGVVAIPIGIISAGFVEQYQHKSNISDFLVLRDHLSVLPQKNMILKLNDIIVIHTQEEDSKQIIRNL